MGFLRYSLLLVFLFVGQTSWAQFKCTDYRGIPVSTIYNAYIADGATAKYSKQGQPVILANQVVLSSFSAATKLFIYAHECAHHVLGHLKNRASNRAMEQEADCWALTTLFDRGVFDHQDLRKVQYVIQRYGRNDRTHTRPSLRARNLEKCLVQDTVATTY